VNLCHTVCVARSFRAAVHDAFVNARCAGGTLPAICNRRLHRLGEREESERRMSRSRRIASVRSSIARGRPDRARLPPAVSPPGRAAACTSRDARRRSAAAARWVQLSRDRARNSSRSSSRSTCLDHSQAPKKKLAPSRTACRAFLVVVFPVEKLEGAPRRSRSRRRLRPPSPRTEEHR